MSAFARPSVWRRLSPADWTALGLLAFSIAWVAIEIFSDVLDAWAISLATSALTVAATISIVDRIVRSSNRKLQVDRRNELRKRLVFAFSGVAVATRGDYVTTHARPEEGPTAIDKIIAQWRDGLDSADRTRDPSRRSAMTVAFAVISFTAELREARSLAQEIGDYLSVQAFDPYVAVHGESVDNAGVPILTSPPALSGGKDELVAGFQRVASDILDLFTFVRAHVGLALED